MVEYQVFLPAQSDPVELEDYMDYMLSRFTEEHLNGQEDPNLPAHFAFYPGAGSRAYSTEISWRDMLRKS